MNKGPFLLYSKMLLGVYPLLVVILFLLDQKDFLTLKNITMLVLKSLRKPALNSFQYCLVKISEPAYSHVVR